VYRSAQVYVEEPSKPVDPVQSQEPISRMWSWQAWLSPADRKKYCYFEMREVAAYVDGYILT